MQIGRLYWVIVNVMNFFELMEHCPRSITKVWDVAKEHPSIAGIGKWLAMLWKEPFEGRLL